MLNYMTFGDEKSPPVMIVHGLYGSGRNWGVIAKRLSDQFFVITVDLRNHGDSPWLDTHNYHVMADDLVEVINSLNIKPNIIGHSMGGKAAMVLALKRPNLVRNLIIADIAPVKYEHDQSQFIEAMQKVDLSKVEKRSDATLALSKFVEDKSLQNFFTQSLDIKAKRWKLNLKVLRSEMSEILSFPKIESEFSGHSLFLKGEKSDYIKSEHRKLIKSLFTKARFATFKEAGHWLHAEKPREFESAARLFFS
ncbi:MAG: alpha/beta fold hydrolase [Paracoccaceae bacterium]|jgi:esterase|nr:alpha/beta fold hydrolase [Paracoccaceae bacterium]NCV48476.1 alpha/beta fold hydrolase [Rhodobacterales bacterium]NDA28951.1 alpha/beta fold hydrolase [Alphaproteobacteria bacterium]NCW05783.1 alpha/beta fold hydrolase [Rhodobacterales bacterium]NCX27433.1 alpha/beta fold hydrolase [Rhodobacterales bacterium]